MNAVRRGERPELLGARFATLTLGNEENASRIMVRDWMQGDFLDLAQAVFTWFDDLAVIDQSGGVAPAPRFGTSEDPCLLSGAMNSIRLHQRLPHISGPQRSSKHRCLRPS